MNLFQILIICLVAFTCALGTRHIAITLTAGNTIDARVRSKDENSEKLRNQGIAFFNKLGEIFANHTEDDKKESKIKLHLAQCGMPIDQLTWYGMRVSSVLAAVVIFLSIVGFAQPESKWIIVCAFLCATIGLGAPSLYLANKKKKRAKEISFSLPSTLELLSCSVRSGYTLERGIRLVGQRTNGALASEFKRVDQEMNLLNMPLGTSLKRMKDRCDVACVTYFANAMIQANKQGTSIGRTLNSQAIAARNQYYADVLVAINELPNKMVPVIFIVFFPIIIILATAPVIYNAAQQFASIM